jgi:hypothetical protein
MARREIVPNQVFIGCPHKIIRKKYEQVIDTLNKQFPLSFVLVGRDERQDAEDLLEIIKEKLTSSSYAIFDATNGNANVSLEYGLAEASEIPRALYFGIHKSSKSQNTDSSIIADLAGKWRNQYKQIGSLRKMVAQNARNHPYTKRFEKFVNTKFKDLGKKKRRLRSLALKIIHSMDNVDNVRREDVVQNLLAEGYKSQEINRSIRLLHKESLLLGGKGPFATLSIPPSRL